MNERNILFVAFTVGLLGLLTTIGVLLFRNGSKAPILIIVAVAIGAALITVAVTTYFSVTEITYRRVKDARLRQASSATTDIPQPIQEQLRDLLETAAAEVASQQQLEESLVRAALLLPVGQSLRMIPGLAWHIDDPDELAVRIGPGQGSSGRAFQTGQSNIAIYHDAHSDSSLPEQERRRVDSRLKWIISTPILGDEGAVVGVLNVDGLAEKAKDDLVASAGSLAYWAQLAGLILGRAAQEV